MTISALLGGQRWGGGGGHVCTIGYMLRGVVWGKGWGHLKPDIYRRALASTFAA